MVQKPPKSGSRSTIRTQQTPVYKQILQANPTKKGRKSTSKIASKKFTYPGLDDRFSLSMKMQFQKSLAHRPLGSQSMGISQTPFSQTSYPAPI
jgi:hypothetical protein